MDVSSVLIKAGVTLALTLNTAKMETNLLPKYEIPLFPAHATVYYNEGTTCSGTETRNGICAAKEEWIGKTIVMYKRLPDNSVGDLIGYYSCEDTGGSEGIKSGKVIDVWKPDEESGNEFINITYEDDCQGKIYIQIIDTVG